LDLNELRDRRLNAWEQAKALLDTADSEKRDLTAEENEKYTSINGDIDALDSRLNEYLAGEKRAREAEAAFNELMSRPVKDEQRSGATAADELRAFARGEKGRALDIRPKGEVDYRTLSKLSAGAGGNLVPTDFYGQLVAHMIEVSGILSAGPTVLNTSGGEALQVPKTTAHSSSASIVAEAGTLTANEPTFGQVSLGAYKYGFLIQLSHELLNDRAVNLEGYLAMQAGRALGNGFGAHLVTGTGTSQPSGVVTGASLGVTGNTGVAGLPTADNLIDLFFSVIRPYRGSNSCGWLMRDATLGAIRKLKDGNGRYLFEPAATVGAPDTLLGKPINVDPNVAAVAVSAKPVLFGDFSQYFVRQVEAIRIEQSLDYAFNTDLVTWRFLLRGDGVLVDTTGAVKYYQGAAT
jgi:HK97 family phage major capsid protein